MKRKGYKGEGDREGGDERDGGDNKEGRWEGDYEDGSK